MKSLLSRIFNGSVVKISALCLAVCLVVAAVANAATGAEVKAAAADSLAVSLTTRAHLATAHKAIGLLSDGLDFDKAKTVSNFELAGKEKLSIIIPGPNYGGASVVLDKTGKVTSTLVLKNAIIDDGVNVRSEVFVNGTQTADITVDAKTGNVVAGWKLQGDQKVAMEKGYYGPDAKEGDVGANRLTWACFRDCIINRMGVATWLIGLAGATCAAVCVVTIGAGCVPCLQAVLIGYGAEISFCMSFCRSSS